MGGCACCLNNVYIYIYIIYIYIYIYIYISSLLILNDISSNKWNNITNFK